MDTEKQVGAAPSGPVRAVVGRRPRSTTVGLRDCPNCGGVLPPWWKYEYCGETCEQTHKANNRVTENGGF